VRQCGIIAGIDVMKDAAAGVSFDRRERAGERVCLAAREFGLLTRPIGDTIVLMPPLCVTPDEIDRAVSAVSCAIETVAGP
jgi:adenosylmethionine-8-amino-7-oxononanoate aminotransferase